MVPASVSDSLARWYLARILAALGNPSLELSLGSRIRVAPPAPSLLGTVNIADWRTLLALTVEPDYWFGEGFSRGAITVGGNLLGILTETFRRGGKRRSLRLAEKVRSVLLTLLQANTRNGSRINIHRHYDLGSDFYSLWLDEQLLYTCAYFAQPNLSLEEAQIRKMDLVCRKVRLVPGESVIEAGCGWGALALHMAREYGARVRAFNISREQILYARSRARSEGLDRQVEFIEDDYRNVTGRCDVFVSVGMLEHVGPAHYPQLAAVIDRCLGEEGRAFLHFIGRNRKLPLNPWIRRRVFPGAYPPTLREVLRALEPCNFSILDVENLRLHYARTLEHWLERYERFADRVRARFGEEFERAWRLYLAGSSASFHAGSLQLFQVTFARGACNSIPWTREDIYRSENEVQKESPWTPAMS